MKRVVCLAATGEAPPSKTNTSLTSAHNGTDDADDYNRVIGIALLKASAVAKIQPRSY